MLTLWYYRIIKCIDFAVGIYLTSKFFDLEEVIMDSKVRNFFRGINMTEIEEEIHAAYVQEAETYDHNSLFPMFLLESPFADWEIRDGLCQKRLHPVRFDTYLKSLHFIRNELPCECCSIGANLLYPNPFDQVWANNLPVAINISKAHRLVGNEELIEKYMTWLKAFPHKEFKDKQAIIAELCSMFMTNISPTCTLFINQDSLITLVIKSCEWEEDVVLFINLLLASGSCSKVVFDINWLKFDKMVIPCAEWIKNAITDTTCYTDLSGVEFQVQSLPLTKGTCRSMIQNLMVDPLSHVEEMVRRDEELKKISDVPLPPDKMVDSTFQKGESSKTTWTQDSQPDPILGGEDDWDFERYFVDKENHRIDMMTSSDDDFD